MSYLLNALQDRAVGYWSFSGTLNDLTSASNTATGTASFTSPPLIAIGGSAMRVTSTASVVINANSAYAGLSSKTYNKTFSIGMWFNFNNQMIGSGNNTGIYKNNQLNIFYIKNLDGTIVAKIYYDYLSNTFRFSVPGTSGTNTEAYYIVRDYDTSFFILATYSNGTIQINVNGDNGNSGIINDLPNYDYTKYYYVIDGSTSLSADIINSSSATNFLLNSLEFLTYKLSTDQIKKKYLWAFNDGKPIFQAKNSQSTSYFSFIEDPKDRGLSVNLSGKAFSIPGITYYYNLDVGTEGIKPLQISPVTIYNKNSVSSSSGINFLTGGSAVWSDFGNYFNLSNTIVLSAQITRSVAAHEYIFYINSVNSYADLYLEYDATVLNNTKYNLNYKDNNTGSVSVLSSLNTGASTTTSNVALSIDSGSIIVYVGESTSSSSVWVGGTSASGPDVSLPLSNNTNSTLSIGSYDNSLSFISKIKNVGITNYPFVASAFNFSSASTFMIKFTNTNDPSIVSQNGYWVYQIQSSFIPTQIVQGTQIDWNGMDTASFRIYSDIDSSYYLSNRGGTASGYSLSDSSKNILLRVDIDTDYTVYTQNQSLNAIDFSIYKNLNLISDSYPYILSPASPSVNNFVLRNYPSLDVIKRPNNFGIKFGGAYPNNSPQYASITIAPDTTYYGIDFWYRADSINQYSGNTSSTNYILSNVSSSISDPAIWIDKNRRINFSSNCILYVNGASVLSGSYTITQDEPYHLFLTSSAALNSNLYLNGYSSGSVNSIATYGYLQFWNNSVVPTSTPSARYQSFVLMPVAKIIDNLNTTTYTDRVVTQKIGI
jgi:hypothetical protein